MKKLKFLLIALTTVCLAACSGNPTTSSEEGKDDYEISIIAPKGAPSLAFYDMAASENFVTAEGEHISEEFGKSTYSMIVMEFYTGLRNVKASNSNYRLARILTGGNLYLVSRSGKTTEPTEDDTVVAFGPGGLQGVPYLSLRKLFPQVKPENINMVKDGAAVKSALISGTYMAKDAGGDKKVDVDYVVIPQPALAGALKELSTTEVKPAIVSCLRDKANEISNGEQKWVLQAGLFVHKNLYAEHKKIFDEKLAIIDSNCNDVINNPEKVKTTIETQLPDVNEQKQKFSCPTPMIPAISNNKKTPNGFGFIPSNEYQNIDVCNFLKFLGVEQFDYSAYLLNR